jgi:hypothetical protein
MTNTRLARLHHLLQNGDQIVDRSDLLVGDQDVGVLDHGFLAVGIGDEVGGDVALVELHPLGELQLEPEGLALLDGDDPVLAHPVHRVGDDLADRVVVVRRDRRHMGDLLGGLDVAGHLTDCLDRHIDGLLDAPLQLHRVGAGGHLTKSFT